MGARGCPGGTWAPYTAPRTSRLCFPSWGWGGTGAGGRGRVTCECRSQVCLFRSLGSDGVSGLQGDAYEEPYGGGHREAEALRGPLDLCLFLCVEKARDGVVQPVGRIFWWAGHAH